ncbi:MAG: N-acetylglucosamine-6-phosphate deacetylase [Tannerella sp.]|jgi:N-acetylglucosamine-6-phosphate deacetylase|nr:N-acetylglucosamine-6-phosphate deacetylase [Tannerella sp.]
MLTCIKNIDIYTEKEIIPRGTIIIENEKIAEIINSSASYNDMTVIDGNGLAAIPGYIDTHCHGGDGFDCNDATVRSVIGMRDFYGRHGITTLFPTLSANSIPDTISGLTAIRSAKQQNMPGRTEIGGCHLEGPFLNKVYKGCQAEQNIISLNDSNLQVYENNRDVVRRTTIAPEVDHNVDFFPAISRMGIQISIGHSCAEYKEVEYAVSQGATSVTHLFNAMSQTKKVGPFRIGGVLEAALTIDNMYAEIIADGFHLPNELIIIAYRCKGPDKITMCSDANHAAGGVQGAVFHTAGTSFLIEQGVAMTADRTSLASSITPIDGMVRHLISNVKLPAFDVVKMASTSTARMMNIYDRKGSIAVGKDADINLVDSNFNIVRTFFRGQES